MKWETIIVTEVNFAMIQLETAYKQIEGQRTEMLELWETLVNTDSGSANKHGVDSVGKKLGAFLQAKGIPAWFYEFEQAGNMLVAEYGDMTKPFIVFLGHMDTVFADGEAAARPFAIRDGKAYGPGVLDMKGGIVIAVSVLAALKKMGYDAYPIKLILTGDEEVAHRYSNAVNVLQKECSGAAAVFNFETGLRNNQIVVERKGVLHAMFRVQGVGAHAGNNPEDGRSAIVEMAHKILALHALTDFNAGNTVNVGVISGGTVANAVSEQCRIMIDIRFINEESRRGCIKALQDIAAISYIDGTMTTVEFPVSQEAMPKLDKTMELFHQVNAICMQEGLAPLTAARAGGGSDSAYTAAMGIPTLCAMGVPGACNHTVHEEADVESLFYRAKLMMAILLNLKLL